MPTATHNSSFLLTAMLQGQGRLPGAAGGLGGALQVIESNGNTGLSPFLDSLRGSLQQLLAASPQGSTPGLLEQAVEQLLAGQAANNGPPLPLSAGQTLAAAGEGGTMASLLAQLGDADGAALVRELRGQAGEPSRQADALEALLKQIRLGAGQETAAAAAPLEFTAVTPPDPAAAIEPRLLAERMAALTTSPGGRPLTPAGHPPEQPANALDGDALSDGAPRAVQSPLPTIPPVLLERAMMAMSRERQPAPEMLKGNDDVLAALTTLQSAQPGGRPATPVIAEARPVQGFVPTAMSDPQWSQDFSSRIVMLAKGGAAGQVQVAEIRLNPAHMGPVEVRVVMQDDQASVTFSAHHSAVRDAIEGSLPRLREMFANSGLQLADAAVADQSLQERRRQHQQSQDGGRRFAAADAGLGAESEHAVAQLHLAGLPASSALDLYA